MKKYHSLSTRITALLLVLICVFGLLPTAALAAGTDTIKLERFAMSGVSYSSPTLGTCTLHQMYYDVGGKTTVGFCGEKGRGMGTSLIGQTWGNPTAINNSTIKTMMAYYYCHSTGTFTDQAHALGVDDVWDSGYAWYMDAWVQACVWRFKENKFSNPVEACAEELMSVFNTLEGTHYTSIDEKLNGTSFRDRTQYILDLGAQGVWGDCKVSEYIFTGAGSSHHPANSVQAIVVGDLNVTPTIKEEYSLTVKKVDATNPTKGLPGTTFHIEAVNGSYSKDVITGENGIYTLKPMDAGTYMVTEIKAPNGYQIDNAGPEYVVLPNGSSNTVTVMFTDTPVVTASGSIRKVDADDPTHGLAGAVIKIQGVDNNFVGTYTTGSGGALTDVPWDTMPIGSYTATEITPPAGYTNTSMPQSFYWDGHTNVALVFTDDAKVKIQLIKKDDSNNPLAGAVFNIVRDGQIIGTEATDASGKITVPNVTEGMYAFIEVGAPAGYACLEEPVFAHVDQATIHDGGTVTVTASDKKLPNLTILKQDGQTSEPVAGAVFTVHGIHYGYHTQVTTGADGKVTLTGIPVDSYRVEEVSVPEPYIKDDTNVQTLYLAAGESHQLVFDNLKKPVLTIGKYDAMDSSPIPNTIFTVEAIDGDYAEDWTTGSDGTVTKQIAPGSYRVTEKAVPDPYIITDTNVRTISLNGGDVQKITFENLKKPLLTVTKADAENPSVMLPGTVFEVKGVDNDYLDDWTTEADGTVSKRVMPGVYEITEKAVPSPYYLPDKDADCVQTISLNGGDEKTVAFKNYKMPLLTIYKEDSVAGAPVEGAKFRVTFVSNGESVEAPATIDFGYLFSDENGEIKLHEQGKRLYPGEYTVIEVEPAAGFQMKEPSSQKIILHGSESKTLTFQNEPLNAIIVEKYDSVTHEALPGATFQLRFLGGTSGTGGTVIGLRKTGKNGTAIWTGLTAGTYIVEELDPADGYSIIQSSETVYLADSGMQSVVSVRFENVPDGSLLIRKVCAVNPSVTLQNAEFKVTYADGTLIGDANGIYRTDENGEIRIEGLKPNRSVIVTETAAPDGYIIDTQSQTIMTKPGRVVTLTFKNQPKGALIIQKRDSVTNQPLSGVEFRVTTAAGCEVGLDGVIGSSTLTQNGIFTTDANGEIRISKLAPGAYVLTEIKTVDGYVIDTPSTNVVIGKNGDTQTVVIKNTPKGTLTIVKLDSSTGKPLPGVTFKVTTSKGAVVGGSVASNGYYKTDVNGTITISGIEPDTYMITETEVPAGYVLSGETKVVRVDAAQHQTVTFGNLPKGNLVIRKIDSVTKLPVSGAEFKVTKSDGSMVATAGGQISSNGIYTTDENGEIRITLVDPATYVVTETKAPDGYILDSTPQTVVVNANDTQTLTFTNTPIGGLQIIKSDADTGKRIKGAKFEVRQMDGKVIGSYTTDTNGVIVLPELSDGWYIVTELKAADGYLLDATPHRIQVIDGKTSTLEITNEKAASLIIHKTDSVTGDGIYGVTFIVYDSGKNPIEQVVTDQDGYAYLDMTLTAGKYYVREFEAAEGYLPDTQYKTVYVTAGKTSSVEWENTPVTAQIQITKYAATNNSITGQAAGTTLKGAVYEIVRERSGVVVGYMTTDARGVAASSPLPLGRYIVKEVTAPAYWQLSGQIFDVTLEYAGQIIKLSDYDKPAELGVSITKTGNKEVLAGNKMTYRFTVANTSNVALENFYWHDKIPYDNSSVSALTTGTYSQRLNYRVLYKTNYTDYRVLASNLLTTNNYSFALSALPLQSGEIVTDIYFDFGTVPSGFQSVAQPTMTVSVNPKAVNGYNLVNRADVGGKYGGTWQTANASWISIIRNLTPVPPTPTLPKTGY